MVAVAVALAGVESESLNWQFIIPDTPETTSRCRGDCLSLSLSLSLSHTHTHTHTHTPSLALTPHTFLETFLPLSSKNKKPSSKPSSTNNKLALNCAFLSAPMNNLTDNTKRNAWCIARNAVYVYRVYTQTTKQTKP